jgi:hypothetical protein
MNYFERYNNVVVQPQGSRVVVKGDKDLLTAAVNLGTAATVEEKPRRRPAAPKR